MRLLGYVLLACLLVSVLRAVIIILCVAFAFMLLWGALFRPQETFGLMLLTAFMLTLQTYPLASVGIAIAMLTLNWLVQRAPRQPVCIFQQLEHRHTDESAIQQDSP